MWNSSKKKSTNADAKEPKNCSKNNIMKNSNASKFKLDSSPVHISIECSGCTTGATKLDNKKPTNSSLLVAKPHVLAKEIHPNTSSNKKSPTEIAKTFNFSMKTLCSKSWNKRNREEILSSTILSKWGTSFEKFKKSIYHKILHNAERNIWVGVERDPVDLQNHPHQSNKKENTKKTDITLNLDLVIVTHDHALETENQIKNHLISSQACIKHT